MSQKGCVLYLLPVSWIFMNFKYDFKISDKVCDVIQSCWWWYSGKYQDKDLVFIVSSRRPRQLLYSDTFLRLRADRVGLDELGD